MASILAQVGDAVVAKLANAALSQSFAPTREWAPLFDVKDVAALRVSVVPMSRAVERATRGADQHVVELSVAAQKQLDSDRQRECDDLVELLEEIGQTFAVGSLLTLSSGATARCTASGEQNPPLVPEHLRERDVFTGAVSLAFLVME